MTHIRDSGATEKCLSLTPAEIHQIAPREQLHFDSSLLVEVVTVVDRMLEAEGLHLDRTAKANLISAIYELMLSEEGDDRALETMAANVISYEKVRLRGKR